MSTISFEGENEQRKDSLLYGKFQKSSETPGIITFLLKHHIVKSEQQAKTLLVGLFFFFIVLSIVILIYSNFSSYSLTTLPLR